MTGVRRDCVCPRANHQHGTLRAYNADACRCFACRVAHANATRAYRAGGHWRGEGRVDATGTRRRLRALAAVGVTARQISERGGLSVGMVAKLRNAPGEVFVASAAAVTEAYAALWDKSRNDADARRCRTQALAAGWAPPLAWDDETIDDPQAKPHGRIQAKSIDEIAIERAMHGERIPLSREERAEAFNRLTAAGLSATGIAARLHTTERTVTRRRRVAAPTSPSTEEAA